MTIELFKNEDVIIMQALDKLLSETDVTDKETRDIIYKLIDRVYYTRALYKNMYGR